MLFATECQYHVGCLRQSKIGNKVYLSRVKVSILFSSQGFTIKTLNIPNAVLPPSAITHAVTIANIKANAEAANS
jgi:hypothetical protein